MKKADVDDGTRPGVTTKDAGELREAKKVDPVARAGERGPAPSRRLPVPGELAGKIVFPLVRAMAAASTRVRMPAWWRAGCSAARRRATTSGSTTRSRRRDSDDARLIDAALEVHADDPGYGYQLIADELAEAGIAASENRVWRLCSVQRIFSAHSKRRGTGRDQPPLAGRHHPALGPGQPVPIQKVVRLLKNNGLRGSTGRVGACANNAAMESFFPLLQKNVLNTRRWATREELRLAIVTWIETGTTGTDVNAASANSPRSSSR